VGRVTSAMSMSLDGSVGELGDRGWRLHGRLHRWKFDLAVFRQRLGQSGGETTASSAVLEEEFRRPGAYVMGRRMFDAGEGPWGDTPPFHAPVFVLTHRPRETLVKSGGTSFTFVEDGIERAVEQARAAAGEKDVFISGGASAVQQAIKAALLDELRIDLAPVLFGEGIRLFEHLPAEAIDLETMEVIEGRGVTHLKLRLSK
jgi:dihydrofolate reductase